MINFFINDLNFFLHNFTIYLDYLIENKNDITIITPEAVNMRLNKSINYKYIPLNRREINLKGLLGTLFKYFLYINRKEKNIFITIVPIMIGSFVSRLKNARAFFYFTGLGTVFISQGTKAIIIREFIKIYFKVFLNCKGNTIIVQNKSDYKLFYDDLKFRKASVNIINGCGVNTEKYKFNKKKSLNNKLSIFVPARLIREKGIKECVDASQMLNNQNIEHEFLISSEIDLGNPSSFSESEIKTFSEAPNVNFIGFVDDIKDVYSDCDIVCLPSYREGLPNCLIEASSIGRLIIASDVPGCNDIISHNENGLLFEKKSSESIYNTILLIANKEVDVDKLVDAAYKKVNLLYTNEKILDQLLSII